MNMDDEELHGLAHYHQQVGNIQVLETGFASFRITFQGIAKVEAEMPLEARRVKRRHFLRAVYDLAGGSSTEFVYWRNHFDHFVQVLS
jgi:hypothetical protein